MRKYLIAIIIAFLCHFGSSCSDEQRTKKNSGLRLYPEELKVTIGRGLIALPASLTQVFLTWRLLPDDPPQVSFNVYRREVSAKDDRFHLIAQTNHTYYIDRSVRENSIYEYATRAVVDGKLGELSKEVRAVARKVNKSALVFDLGQPYKTAHVATGDLNGDGELEVVVKYADSKSVDPYKKAWHKSDDTLKVTAFLRTGERLWTYDLGWGIEAGQNYSPMVVWDINSDGRAEVLLKTNKSGDRLDYASERLSVIDGQSGEVIKEAKWPIITGHFADNYNNNSRNFMAVAHLDGKNPYIIVARGIYKTQVIWAYDNQLNKVWERTIGRDLHMPVKNKFLKKIWARFAKDRGRGSHSLPIVDINGDGKEEILWGEHCIGENGKDLWVINERMPYRGHPDIIFAADILPSNEGKEVFYCREGWNGKDSNIGMMLANMKGETIWGHWGYTHVDGGWVGNILPDSEGLQCFGFDVAKKKWSTEGAEYKQTALFLWESNGKLAATPPESWVDSFPVDWDGDGIQEICTRENGDVQKYNGPLLAELGKGCLWGADLFGDHREEIVVAPGIESLLIDTTRKESRTDSDLGKIYIFFNTDNAGITPRITRLADRQYRNDLSRTAMQFNVIPTEGGYVLKGINNTR